MARPGEVYWLQPVHMSGKISVDYRLGEMIIQVYRKCLGTPTIPGGPVGRTACRKYNRMSQARGYWNDCSCKADRRSIRKQLRECCHFIYECHYLYV